MLSSCMRARQNHRMKSALRLALSLLVATCGASTAGFAVPMPATPEAGAADLTSLLTSPNQIWDAVVALPDDRLVLEAPRWLGSAGPQLSISIQGSAPVPYPDAGWNETEGDTASRFVALTGMTRAADGALWVIDSGVPNRDAPSIAPPRLIRIDTTSNQITKIIPISASALRSGSVTGGIAVHGNRAYVPDSGSAGLIVVDLDSGSAQRFLDHVQGLAATRPIMAADGVVRARDGRPLAIDASLIAVSPDGKWIYVQPYCGPLYRIATSLFDDPDSTSTALQESATLWYKTQALGGLTVGPDGTLYWSDVTTGSIDSYTEGRIPHHLITDPRLRWPGGLSLAGGRLIVPAAQLDKAARFQNGQAAVQWPVTVYSFKVPADATSNELHK